MMIKTIKFSPSALVFVYTIFLLIFTILFGAPFIPLLCISVIEIYRQIKKNSLISAYSFWQIGFAFIICLDGILMKEKIVYTTSITIYYRVAIMFCISNLLIIWRYRHLEKKLKPRINHSLVSPNATLFLIIAFLYSFFMLNSLPGAYVALLKSRFEIIAESSFGGLSTSRSLFDLFASFVNQYSGYILPSLIFIWNIKKYTLNKALLIAFFFSAPIWAIYLVGGTRHHILYSFLTMIGCYTLLKLKKFELKSQHILILILAYFVSNTVLEARKYGLLNYLTGKKDKRYSRLKRTITDETTVYMGFVLDYYNKNNFEYGSSTAAILMFWIPRSIWHEKPTQFGYWFIRAYYGGEKGFSSKHSAPASYIAPVYSDFGYLGVITLSLLIGYLLNYADTYFNRKKEIEDFRKLILIAFFLASAFFLPRQLSHLFSKFVILFFLLQTILKLSSYKLVNKKP